MLGSHAGSCRVSFRLCAWLPVAALKRTGPLMTWALTVITYCLLLHEFGYPWYWYAAIPLGLVGEILFVIITASLSK